MITLIHQGKNEAPRTRINLLNDSLAPMDGFVARFVKEMREKGLDPEAYDIAVRTEVDEAALEKVCKGYAFISADDDVALKLAQGFKPTILEMVDSYKPHADFAKRRGASSRYALYPNPDAPVEDKTFETKWVEVEGKRYKVSRTGHVAVKVAKSDRRGPYMRTLLATSPVGAKVRRASGWFV